MSVLQSTLPPLPVQEGVEFRHVAEFRGYCVGDNGSLWSCRGLGGSGGHMLDKWHEVRGHVGNTGYFYVTLYEKGKKYLRTIHKLILTAFLGQRPDGMEACHSNGIRTDNRLSNLRWGTHQSNVDDTVRHDRIRRGSRCTTAVLTEDTVRAMRRLAAEGVSRRQIAAVFNVAYTTANGAINGTKWKHVP